MIIAGAILVLTLTVWLVGSRIANAIADIQLDPEELNELAAELKASSDELSQAVKSQTQPEK